MATLLYTSFIIYFSLYIRVMSGIFDRFLPPPHPPPALSQSHVPSVLSIISAFVTYIFFFFSSRNVSCLHTSLINIVFFSLFSFIYIIFLKCWAKNFVMKYRNRKRHWKGSKQLRLILRRTWSIAWDSFFLISATISYWWLPNDLHQLRFLRFWFSC